MKHLLKLPTRVIGVRCRALVSARFKGTDESKKPDDLPVTAPSKRAPSPTEIKKDNAVYDQITHTGQAWDSADHRLSRFTYSEKQVNPNIAAHLIAEIPPIASDEHVVFCDGGNPALGHPKVYINLDKPGTHACGYCGLRYYNVHATKQEDMDNAHIQV
ncbi:zinc-finger domain-containing protein [Ditylenchus destructor]|uniref:Zinc-finger domain-containing protein n=1 Tax=Ditylenchus destructor TaxID=166010 RepID=A0AAD4RAF0_9BILA|nr:zinc-finger domain-containing protein [Ditylenchus destructor]